MSKKISIQYCGATGLGGSALKLKKTIIQAFPGTQIQHVQANGATGKIQVSWYQEGTKNIVWSNTKEDTESSHPTIVQNLKLCEN